MRGVQGAHDEASVSTRERLEAFLTLVGWVLLVAVVLGLVLGTILVALGCALGYTYGF